MALVFLKEITKSNNPTLINYLDKKLLSRLYAIAIVPEGEKCLLPYNSKADPKDSERFQYLLRECFTNWGSAYKSINKNYIVYTTKLAAKNKVLNLEEKYWNFPFGVANVAAMRGDSIINDFPEDALQQPSNVSVSDVSRGRSNSPNPMPISRRENQANSSIRNNSQAITNVGELKRKHLHKLQNPKRKNSAVISQH